MLYLLFAQAYVWEGEPSHTGVERMCGDFNVGSVLARYKATLQDVAPAVCL